MTRYDANFAILEALGKVSGVSVFEKFGSNSDVDAVSTGNLIVTGAFGGDLIELSKV